MRIDRAIAGLTVAVLVAATVAADRKPASPGPGTDRPCAASWRLVDTPPVPDQSTITPGRPIVLSTSEVYFVASRYVVNETTTTPWPLRWDGRTISEATPMPAVPLGGQTGGHSSFHAADGGWVVATIAGGVDTQGQQFMHRWHEGRWTMTPAAVSARADTALATVAAVASVSETEAWAVGTDGGQAMIQRWDGARWSTVASPAPTTSARSRLRDVTAIAPDDVWAVGDLTPADGSTTEPFVVHWDGTRWSVVPTPALPADQRPLDLRAVSGTSGDVWAVGVHPADTPSQMMALALHWDGRTWTVVPTPETVMGDIAAANLDIYAAGPTDVWVVGPHAREEPRGSHPVLLNWNGTAWQVVPAPVPTALNVDYRFSGVSGSGPGDVWVTGLRRDGAGGRNTPVIAHLSCARGRG